MWNTAVVKVFRWLTLLPLAVLLSLVSLVAISYCFMYGLGYTNLHWVKIVLLLFPSALFGPSLVIGLCHFIMTYALQYWAPISKYGVVLSFLLLTLLCLRLIYGYWFILPQEYGCDLTPKVIMLCAVFSITTIVIQGYAWVNFSTLIEESEFDDL